MREAIDSILPTTTSVATQESQVNVMPGVYIMQSTMMGTNDGSNLVLILDGSSKHVAHVLRNKGSKNDFCRCKDFSVFNYSFTEKIKD